MEVLRKKIFIIRHAYDLPTGGPEHLISFGIPQDNIGMVVNATVNLDHQTGGFNGKINNEAPNRMLTPDGKTELSEMPERLPRRILSACRRLPQVACSFGWLIHPLTLNPSPHWGEGLLNYTVHSS